MKFKLTLISLLICTGFLQAQDLTGIWRGYFYSGIGFYKQQYKYEVQINQLKNKALRGVTYSYRTTVFYGKADLRGVYMSDTKNIVIKEDSLVEVKMADRSVACLMTCYLQYYKSGSTEVLEGTFTSVNTFDGSDCGSGNVYLERVPESDFQKEDFLLKKEKKISPPLARKSTPKTQPSTKKATPPPTVRKTTPESSSGNKTNPPVTKKVTPSTKSNTQPLTKKTTPAKPPVKVIPKKDSTSDQSLTKIAPIKPPVTNDTAPKRIPVPPVIKQRENSLVKTLITNSPDIKIELYDNGEIDGDTITVYHNNRVVAYKKGLSAEPIVIRITANMEDAHHEFVMVADNLGKIPPNTALMVITTGGKRYELFISSNEQKNAKVVIEYKVPGRDTK